ncbi:MAG TPA: hypothetical protein VFL83_05855 [Anaeromyxobacter sp.]|nr:hypothetical protein [Anaeromyxobacter sp.]
MPEEAAVPPRSAPARRAAERIVAGARGLAGWPLLGVAAAALVAAAVRRVVRAPQIEADTVQVVLGAARALRCLEGGAATCPDLSYFPPLQYLPSAVVLLAGGSPGDAMRGLAWLNLAAWIGTSVLLAAALRRARGAWAAALALAAWLGGYGLAYANTTFGEVLTGFLALAFAVGCARRWPWAATGVLGLLAGLGKETAPPFLALIGASASLLPPGGARDARRFPWDRALAVALAVAGSAGANAAFNLWRYGETGNPFLLQPILRAPGVAQWLSALAALWISPNGGLLPFAPAAAALVCGAGAWALWRAARGADRWTSAAPALGALGLLAAATLGLAAWYSPFGWWAWGPRLVLPWLPACLFLALASPLPWGDAAARAARSRGPFALGAALLGGAVVIHAAALADPGEWLGHFTANPACGVVIIQRDPIGFYDYLGCLMWSTDRFLLGRMVRAALDPAAIGTVIAAVALEIALLWRARALWLERAAYLPTANARSSTSS